MGPYLETYWKPCLSNRTQRPSSKSKEKRARWEERWSAACRAHVRHSRVAHAADLSLSIDRERGVKGIALCYGCPSTYGLYATTTVMWAVQIGLIFPNHSERNLYAALVRRCMHKGLELFSYLNLKDRTLPYSRTLCRALPCPHFLLKGPKKSLHLLPTVFLRNYTERVDPPLSRLF